jgi:hypothetical protein
MKTIKLLVCLLCLLASCCKRHSRTVASATDITVISDLTDSFLLYPLSEPILALYDFNGNADQAARFQLVLISDKRYNPSETATLESGAITEEHNTNDDIELREQVVYAFQDAIRKIITELPKRFPVHPLGHSECFATVASELQRLATNEASQRILIIYSDLAENTEDFSLYRDHDERLLQDNPRKVLHILQKKCSLPDNLTGISVYLVYNPPNRESDIRYSRIVALYQSALKARGARVIIQSSNKTYAP